MSPQVLTDIENSIGLAVDTGITDIVITGDFNINMLKSWKENPQKLTQLSSRSHPRHLVGKRTAQRDTITDTTSDSQVNSNFPYRWSPASLTFNNYFYLFSIFIYNVNNHKQQRATSKITKEIKQKSRLGTASNKNNWEASTSVRSTNPRPYFCLDSSDT